MQRLSKQCFNEQMAILTEMYEQDISETKEKIMYQTLCDIPDDIFSKGIIIMLRDRKYNAGKFPQISEIREFCIGNKADVLQNKAEIAKDLIIYGIQKYGQYESIAFEDPVIHAIIKNRLGGWIKVCTMEREELNNFLKFDFWNAYKAYAGQGIGIVDKVLRGRAEIENNGKYKAIEYKTIGDAEKIKRWHNKIESLECGINGDIKRLAESKKMEG